jgi:hypothetical protein
MANYHKITEMLEDELDKIASNGKLTTSSLEVGDKAAHFLKSIKTIEAMDEAEEGNSYGYAYDSYSMRNGGNMSRNSYARGRGSNANRDSRGRYASRYDGYSQHAESKDELMNQLEMLKEQIQELQE